MLNHSVIHRKENVKTCRGILSIKTFKGYVGKKPSISFFYMQLLSFKRKTYRGRLNIWTTERSSQRQYGL